MYSIMPHCHRWQSDEGEVIFRMARFSARFDPREKWDYNWPLNYAFKGPAQGFRRYKVHCRRSYDKHSGESPQPFSPPRMSTLVSRDDRMRCFILIFTVTPAIGVGVFGRSGCGLHASRSLRRDLDLPNEKRGRVHFGLCPSLFICVVNYSRRGSATGGLQTGAFNGGARLLELLRPGAFLRLEASGSRVGLVISERKRGRDVRARVGGVFASIRPFH